MDLKQGDIVQSIDNPEIKREIVEPVDGGYIWKYPNHEKQFHSADGCTPFFDFGWVKLNDEDKKQLNMDGNEKPKLNDIDRFNKYNVHQINFTIDGLAIVVHSGHLEGTEIKTGIADVDDDGVLTLHTPDAGEIRFGSFNAIHDIKIAAS